MPLTFRCHTVGESDWLSTRKVGLVWLSGGEEAPSRDQVAQAPCKRPPSLNHNVTMYESILETGQQPTTTNPQAATK